MDIIELKFMNSDNVVRTAYCKSSFEEIFRMFMRVKFLVSGKVLEYIQGVEWIKFKTETVIHPGNNHGFKVNIKEGFVVSSNFFESLELPNELKTSLTEPLQEINEAPCTELEHKKARLDELFRYREERLDKQANIPAEVMNEINRLADWIDSYESATEPREILFQTDDGIDVFNHSDEIHMVLPKAAWDLCSLPAKKIMFQGSRSFKAWKLFYRKENAVKFIKDNKPMYSRNDVFNCIKQIIGNDTHETALSRLKKNNDLEFDF